MQIITEKELKNLLENSGVSLVLRNKNGQEVGIDRSITFNVTGGEIKLEGYVVEIERKMRKCKTYNALVQYLKKVGAVDKEIVLLQISGRYESIAELEEAVAFERLNMQGIIQKYQSMADSFELVAPFEVNVAMTKEEGDLALKTLRNEQFSQLKNLYDRLSEEEKKICQSFDELCAKIEAECRIYFEKCKKEGKFFDGTELLSKSNNPYADLEEAWHFYHSISFMISCEERVKDYQSAPEKRTGYAPLQLPKNAVLKKNLISVTPSFCWHCTTSGGASNVFRFALNQETIDWLLNYPLDYDLEELEDLAFYQGEKLLFSSCTHEGFHVDYSKE